MQASDFICPESVILDLSAPSKTKVIEVIAKQAGAALGVSDSVISKALLHRESLGSTGVGEGVAIPHAPVPGLLKPTAWLARLRKTVDFESIDGLPVDLVLALLTPDDRQKDHLNALACVARRLRSQEVLQAMRAARSTEQLYAALTCET
jgi:PTS system nitrogen regulatory IIA component